MSFFNDIRIVFVCYPLSWILGTTVMVLFYFKGSVILKTVKSQT